MAGTSFGTLAVNISLRGGSDICTSQTLSQATNAVVRVVCANDQFVSIEANPVKPFLGTHSAAYRYYFAPGLPSPKDSYDDISPFTGVGTVTAMRIQNMNGKLELIELLVSF